MLAFVLTNEIQTSNVFVANLPPHVSEQSLGNFFARVGPVGSVSVCISVDLSFTNWRSRLKLCGHEATARLGLVRI